MYKNNNFILTDNLVLYELNELYSFNSYKSTKKHTANNIVGIIVAQILPIEEKGTLESVIIGGL